MVALKFMRSHEQYMCEIRSRSCLAIQKDHVVGIIKHYGGGDGDLEVRYDKSPHGLLTLSVLLCIE